MNATLLMIACFMLVGLAFFHSFMGQKLLIKPLLDQRAGMMDAAMPRTLILFGWHATTVLMLLPAIYLFLVASGQTEGSIVMILAIGLAFVGQGAANLIMARARHPGGYLLSISGIVTILSLYI